MRFSRTVAYALRATVCLARFTPGVPIPCSQLAREGGLPDRFLLQILRELVRHGLLESTCGVAGGYFLSRSARQISLADIADAFDGQNSSASLPMLDSLAPGVQSRIIDTLQSAARRASRTPKPVDRRFAASRRRRS